VTIGLDEPDPLGRLSAEVEATRREPTARGPAPLVGGWMVALAYELGARLEPAVGETETDPDWPWGIVLWRCPSVLAYDHVERAWWSIGRELGGVANTASAFDERSHVATRC